jgi:hypothetical protein
VTEDRVPVSKRGLRAVLDILSPVATGMTAIGGAVASGPNTTWKQIFGWVGIPAVIAIVTQVTSSLLTRSLESQTASRDWAVCGALRQLYRDAFGETPGHRVTLFRQDPRKPDELVATHRFALGLGPVYRGRDSFSRARFRRGEALAGFAWEYPRKLYFTPVPGNITGDGYNEWAKTAFRMSDEQLANLSQETRRKKWFAAVGLVDDNGAFLGVICLDSETPAAERSDGTIEGVGTLDVEETAHTLRFLLR